MFDVVFLFLCYFVYVFFFFKQKTAYEMRISDWSSDVCSSDLSDMTLLKVLRDMSEPYHVHGFRSAFTDWAANEGFADAVVEAALAHKTPDAVQAAYRRTTYLGTPDKPGARVKLMAAWGRYCASGVADMGNVVPLPGKKA